MFKLINRISQGDNSGWGLAVAVSAALHLLALVWLLIGIEPQPSTVVRHPLQGKPVIAEAIDPQWADQELARLDQIKADRAQELKVEQQKVKELEQEKAKEQAARKLAEKKKAESERQLAAVRKQEEMRLAEQQKAAAEKARLSQLTAQLNEEKQRKETLAKQEAKKLAEQREKQRLEQIAKQEAELKLKQQREKDQAAKLAAAKLEQERQRAEAALQAQLSSEQAILDRGLVEQHIAAIQGRVANNWFRPMNWRDQTRCDVAVKLIPGGDVISAQVIGSCGSAVFDRSVEAAVMKASPLPVPQDPRLFNENFRSFIFVFRNDE